MRLNRARGGQVTVRVIYRAILLPDQPRFGQVLIVSVGFREKEAVEPGSGGIEVVAEGYCRRVIGQRRDPRSPRNDRRRPNRASSPLTLAVLRVER